MSRQDSNQMWRSQQVYPLPPNHPCPPAPYLGTVPLPVIPVRANGHFTPPSSPEPSERRLSARAPMSRPRHAPPSGQHAYSPTSPSSPQAVGYPSFGSGSSAARGFSQQSQYVVGTPQRRATEPMVYPSPFSDTEGTPRRRSDGDAPEHPSLFPSGAATDGESDAESFTTTTTVVPPLRDWRRSSSSHDTPNQLWLNRSSKQGLPGPSPHVSLRQGEESNRRVHPSAGRQSREVDEDEDEARAMERRLGLKKPRFG